MLRRNRAVIQTKAWFGRQFWTALGIVMVALGGVGALLPFLPTVPFLLLAAACFARGSPRAYHWLTHNRHFGSALLSYREGRGLSVRAKIFSLAFLYAALLASALIMQAGTILTAVLVIIGVGVSIHVLTIKTATVME